MIRVLNDTRRNNRIYIRLLNGKPGAVVNGEALTALPPSVLSVLEERQQRRQLHADSQRRCRRMGAADGFGGERLRMLAIDVEARAGGPLTRVSVPFC